PMLGQFPELKQFFNGLNNGNGQMQFRQFGPGVIVGGNDGAANVPNDVSISIKKDNGQPAHITVKRGGQTWEAVEGDEDSLDSFPADLRPFVERMLNGNHAGVLNFNANGGMPQMNMPEMNLPGDRSLQQRLDAMERKLQQLMEHQQHDTAKPAGESK